MTAITRQEVEDFLYHEAALLDSWRLNEWVQLLTEDATYHVPATDTPNGDPLTTLSLISEGPERIRARVKQLLGKNAWSESPPSRTRRVVSNVRILTSTDDTVEITANFIVCRFRHENMDTYVGHYEHTLVRTPSLKIKRRKAILDLEALRPHGKLSIIL